MLNVVLSYPAWGKNVEAAKLTMCDGYEEEQLLWRMQVLFKVALEETTPGHWEGDHEELEITLQRDGDAIKCCFTHDGADVAAMQKCVAQLKQGLLDSEVASE